MKLKRIFVISAGLILVLLMVGFYAIPRYAVNFVKHYDPYTFERVLENDTMRVHYGINEKSSPADYGFPDFEEISLSSIHDGNRLSSWYVPAARPSQKTIILIHGRWSNRLKTMKYLELIKSSGLDSLYNVMIPDLRNSGRSEIGITMMGYEFAEDILTNMLWLAQEKKQKNTGLYSFSMGAMAVAVLLNRPELMKEIDAANLRINKIILDSPVANVEKILTIGGQKLGLPLAILDETFDIIDEEYSGFAKQMKFSVLLRQVQIPILILQGTNDQSQPTEILLEELESLNNPAVSLELFENGEHVRLYQKEEFKNRYSEVVTGFLSKPSNSTLL